MKKNKSILLLAFFAIITNYGIAQTIDLTPMYGWQMNGDISFVEGNFEMDGAQMLGGSMDIMVAEGMGIRLMYSYNKADANFYPNPSYSLSYPRKSFQVINDYYQIGTIRGFSTGTVEPYGLFTLGAARFKGEGQDVDTDGRWKFAMQAGLGAKIFFNERIGLKLEGSFMMPIYFAGVGFYFGTGGSGASVNGAVPLLQGNFNGGLVFRLEK